MYQMKINLIEYFEETAVKYREKIAVWEGDQSITFGLLREKALSLAQILINNKDITCLPVAVFLPKSIRAVWSNLSITYSGNPYMNLDIKTPAIRIQNILELIRPQAVITDTAHVKIVECIVPAGVSIINLDELDLSLGYNYEVIMKRLSHLIDTDPYCIINTSGSTGTPKGGVLNHKSFFDFMIRSEEIFPLTDDEVIGSLSPAVFDIYVYELCLLMSKSSTMVLIPDNLSAFPAAILKILQEKNVTYIFWVPTIMVNIANMGLLSQIELPDLKIVWFAGEVFPTKQFNIWRKSLPHVIFANLYGPIEITLDCVFYIVERDIKDEEPIPIGFAYKNTDILILDEENKCITESNKEGELCVRGTSLAMGYYNNPEKTATAFVQNPLNNSYPEIIYRTGDVVFINDLGEIVFKGRKDSLIKHMGYRIELGEIEHVIINTLKMVKNGCVVYNYAKKEITLYYEHPEEISPSVFRKTLSGALPKYMIPSVFCRLDEMQRNTNGKIDRLFYKNEVNSNESSSYNR